MKATLPALLALAATLAAAEARALPQNWGLLAPSKTPMKAVYFFPGDPPHTNPDPAHLWPPSWSGDPSKPWPFTLSPYNDAYLAWDGRTMNQDAIVAEIAASHANVITMSTWFRSTSDVPQGSIQDQGPMWPDWPSSYKQLFDAVLRLPASSGVLQIEPAIEGIENDPTFCPASTPCPGNDYPASSDTIHLGAGAGSDVTKTFLYDRVARLVRTFLRPPADTRYASVWAQAYDLNGTPRYVINLLHMTSLHDTSPSDFARGLDALANAIEASLHEKVGFTIDPWHWPGQGQAGYSPAPATLAPALLSVNAFLGIQAFNPEITVGACDPQNLQGDPILSICPANGDASLNGCGGTCTDQNRSSNLASLIAWKRQWVADWVNAGVPTLLDVSPGYDGRLVFHGGGNVGIYGDNAYDGTDDRFRNGESEMKRAYANGNTLQGIVYNAWNGFAEALTATWTCPKQEWTGPDAGAQSSCWPITTQRSWLTDQFSVDPRYCDHVVYSHGSSGSDPAHVYGAICDHWQALGGSVGYNEPSTSEYGTPGGNRANDFVSGGSIYWSQATGAREVHGAINACYKHFGTDGKSSAFFTFGPRPSMGLPTTDESGTSTYRYNSFQNGSISYNAGATQYCINGWGCVACP